MRKLEYQKCVQRFDLFEAAITKTASGNPFTDHWIRGKFTGREEEVTVDGFYDGDEVYRVRFMPMYEGKYTFIIRADFMESEVAGEFFVTAAVDGNHGPVRVAGQYHFAYEDGTLYYPIGTTCYVWTLQPEQLIQKTLRTLRENVFNKIRFCIFPKHYDYNLGDPALFPYEGSPMDSGVLTKENFQSYSGRTEGNQWDFTRFNVKYFKNIETYIAELQKMGIEADIIAMHPYDRWGFSQMTEEQDDLYWRYIIARFAAYRNIWWSLANEYDLMQDKKEEDWERYAQIICEKDPYHHLRSIHNCYKFYDHCRPWITHCSIQRQDLYKSSELVSEWREQFGKPVVLDEIAYEGNIQHGWGNISGKELLRRFWEAACRGGYPGHGETYENIDDVLWWSHGGELHGESHKRFGLLEQVLNEAPGHGLKERRMSWDEVCAVPEMTAEGEISHYYLFYYSFMRPAFRTYYFDDNTKFSVRVIDTWEMKNVEKGIFSGKFVINLPGKPYMAVQIRAIEK